MCSTRTVRISARTSPSAAPSRTIASSARFTAGASTARAPTSRFHTPRRSTGPHDWGPTVERAGVIFVWYSAESTEPEWELPTIPESDDAAFAFYAPESARWQFRSHPQEVCENTVDIAHFATVHGVSGLGDLELETDRHRLKAVAEVTFQTPRGPVSGAVDSELYGMGLDVVRHRGLGRSCTLLTVTPIDGEFVDARYTFFVQTDPESGEMSRMGLGFARDFCKQIEQDIPIWENKIYRDRPQLARGEGAINEFRAWARQSYEEATA
jgi:3-Ketosteroid 9alpha-hydroxylase C-terminal domain